MEHKLIITPKTRVFQLLEAYPELEEMLVNYVPEFRKLKNPVLRNTVARIATLQQAASIGKVKTEVLINMLRKQVGQDLLMGAGESIYNTAKPIWFNEQLVTMGLDVRQMLAEGTHPVNQVVSDLKILPVGHIYKVIAPFLPAPLIDKATSLGFNHWVQEGEEGIFYVWFCGKYAKLTTH